MKPMTSSTRPERNQPDTWRSQDQVTTEVIAQAMVCAPR